MPPLHNEGRGELFNTAPRRCSRTAVVEGHPSLVEIPDKVQWGPGDVYELHLCPDGQWGLLTLVHPLPEGPEVRNPRIVDTRPGLEKPL